ncbi:S9 family peptidase [Tundrisphaera lichenicola]|uniref:S9 family peptidase n=1 Tax=Tundrisphaera lichenicola TaxID=2029860 RepID=UPI003EC0C76C
MARITDSSADDRLAGGRKKIDATTVARLPAPGSVVPGAFGFTPDGKAVTYLKAETASLSRVLWRAEVSGGPPRVVARPPGGGDTDANVSREEALRRERQRLRETGITQIVRADKAEVAVIPLGGDLYVLRGQDGPLERLTDTDDPEIDPQLNADGSKVGFVRGNELYSLDLGSKQETRLSQGAVEGLTHGLAEFMAQEEMDRSRGFWWSPDGSKIAYQETDERAIPLYSIVHQGAEYSVETHRYPFPGAANAKVRLGVVSSTGGETRWLNLPVDHPDFYLARVDWAGPSELLVQLLSRDQRSLRLCRVDVQENRSTVLIEERAETWVNLHNDLRLVEGTGEILWSSERSGYRHLELYDRDGKKLRELTRGSWPVDGVDHLDSARREVWFSSGIETPLERHLYRVSLDGGPIRKISNDPGTHRAVIARDGETFVDTFSSRSRPPVTRLMSRDGRVIAPLDDAALSDPRVDQLRLTPPEVVRFTGRDGTNLYGAYYAPRSRAFGAKAPLVVLLYGGPHVQYVPEAWSLTADLNAQHFAERGFAVWKMDNRGSSRRGHAFEAAIHRNMGSVEVRDQVDGVRFVARNWPEVDATRVGVSGSSYGGYMTLRCLTEAPETFHAGVSIAPVTDWDGYDTCYTERYMGTPLDNPEGYRNASVLDAVGRLKGELMVIHGMLDENVHFRHTARLVSALIGADTRFRMLPLPEERHSSRKEEGRRYVAEQLATFFEDALSRPVR